MHVWMNDDIFELWEWPVEDESKYQLLTRCFVSWRQYQTALAVVQADLERQGYTVRRVFMPVSEMRMRVSSSR
jgi:hypothetical protein